MRKLLQKVAELCVLLLSRWTKVFSAGAHQWDKAQPVRNELVVEHCRVDLDLHQVDRNRWYLGQHHLEGEST